MSGWLCRIGEFVRSSLGLVWFGLVCFSGLRWGLMVVVLAVAGLSVGLRRERFIDFVFS